MTRVALITGGAQGIGAAVARQFLRDGLKVVLLDRNAEKLASLQKECGADKVETLAADLTDLATPKKAVDLAVQRFGRLDVLVNAAGNTERWSIDDVTPDAYQRMFDVNVRAPIFLMHEAGKVMGKTDTGVVINITSMLAHGGPPNIGIYAASKAALVGMTKNAANAWKRKNIRAYAINLGWVNSDGEHALQTRFHKMPEDWAQRIGSRVPFGRLLVPEDVAGLCAFLLTPPALMMTGNVIDYEQMPMGTYDEYPPLARE